MFSARPIGTSTAGRTPRARPPAAAPPIPGGTWGDGDCATLPALPCLPHGRPPLQGWPGRSHQTKSSLQALSPFAGPSSPFPLLPLPQPQLSSRRGGLTKALPSPSLARSS